MSPLAARWEPRAAGPNCLHCRGSRRAQELELVGLLGQRGWPGRLQPELEERRWALPVRPWQAPDCEAGRVVARAVAA